MGTLVETVDGAYIPGTPKSGHHPKEFVAFFRIVPELNDIIRKTRTLDYMDEIEAYLKRELFPRVIDIFKNTDNSRADNIWGGAFYDLFVLYDSSPYRAEHVSFGSLLIYQSPEMCSFGIGRNGSYDPQNDFKRIEEGIVNTANLYETVRYNLKGLSNDPHPKQLHAPIFIVPSEERLNDIQRICAELGYSSHILDSPHALHSSHFLH